MKEEKQQFNVYLTPQTVKLMKHRSIDEQLSLSDLVEKVFTAYISQTSEDSRLEAQTQQAQENTGVKLQPMLHFEYSASLEELEKKLREAGVTIVRPASDEGFGYQLQLEDPDGMLVKINQIDPELYR